MRESLTEREKEILLLISQGLSNQDIADTLYLSRGTVKAHSHNIYSKLGVSSRTQAVRKAQELGLLTEADMFSTKSSLSNNNLPPQLTPFIGRETELARLAEMLADERVRLITILGAGGMGKTSLALELARKTGVRFKDGALFVTLAQVTNAENIASAIIDDLGLRLQATEKPKQQLLSYLRKQHPLLILDNFEHLVTGTYLITEILQTAPHIRILVTSRERLNISAEIVFVLGGLSYDTDTESIQQEAVQLLLDRARFVNPAFELRPDSWTYVRRICQLTEGMPLALVLAAGWLDMLTLEEIAAELSQNINILESQLHDLPARQRSMHATIASSWKRLSPEEQHIFASLSVFRGGFTRQAAQKVASASLRDLQTLVNRSFITFHSGRYELHELLRQFADTELSQESEAYRHIHDLHCDFYSEFLHERLLDVHQARNPDVISEINLDLDNVRAAWRWAVEHVKIDAMQHATEAMASFWHKQGRYIEGIEVFGNAIRALDNAPMSRERDLLIAIMSTDLGWYHIRLGRLDEAASLFEQGYRTFEQLEFPFTVSTTDPLVGLALVASIRGNYDEAARIAEQALQQNKAHQHTSNHAYALYALTGIKLAQGDYEQARDYGEQAVSVTSSEEGQDQWLKAYCLIELGNVARAMGDDETARRYYHESYTIKEGLDDPEGMAVILSHLGQLALRLENIAEAQRLYQRSLDIYEEIQDQGGLATSLHGLGQVALAKGDYQACRSYLHQALHIANEINYIPLVFAILLTAADLRLHIGQVEQGLVLLAFIQQHSLSHQETRNQAEQMLVDHRASNILAQNMLQSNLPTIVTSIQNELSN